MKLTITIDVDGDTVGRHTVERTAWNPAGLPPSYDMPAQSIREAIDEALEELGGPAYDLEPPA